MVTGESSRPASAKQWLKELGIELPAPPEPFGIYAEAVQTGNLLFLTGMAPTEGRGPRFIGRVGAELDIESGRKAASAGCTQRSGYREATFGIARQGEANCQAWRRGGHFGGCPRPAKGG